MSLRALRERLIPGTMTPMTRAPKHGVIDKAFINQCDDPIDPTDPAKPRGTSVSSFDSQLADALAYAARDLPITSRDLYEALAPEDITAWRNGALGADNLRAFAVALHEGREREAGRIPDSYEDIATCGQCGPVWLFTDGDVPSCPWCINRIAGLPIPRPDPVSCGTCRHFQRNKHPHLGRCGVGMKAHAPAGNWDTDRHDCKRWLPDHE